jgi:hypothetical protein
VSISKAIEVVARLASRGAVRDYAVIGAVAALAYVEPTLTEDVDVLISVTDFEEWASGLITLTPVERALAEMGYTARSDVGFLIEGWPVQFLPVASALDQESLDQAIEKQIDPTTPAVRVIRPEHIVAKAVSVGRLKDLARVEAFLDQDKVELRQLADVIARHDLTLAWKAFCAKAGRSDPLALP